MLLQIKHLIILVTAFLFHQSTCFVLQTQQLFHAQNIISHCPLVRLDVTRSKGTTAKKSDNEVDENVYNDIVEKVQSSNQFDFVRDPMDFSVIHDHRNAPITVDRMLATKPLRNELMTRPGPGGRELTYVSGDSVTRNLNSIFGYNQWNFQILKSDKCVCLEVENPKFNNKLWQVSYSTHVRITHLPSGSFREDIGCGDAMDRSLVVADQNAVKSSVTDALKRAARHFGDKLGNSLYDSEFNINNAPKSLSEAFDLYDTERKM